jgi:hypothetical protein
MIIAGVVDLQTRLSDLEIENLHRNNFVLSEISSKNEQVNEDSEEAEPSKTMSEM